MRITSTIGGYTAGSVPTGPVLVLLSVANMGTRPILIQGAALDLEGGGRLPFLESRFDLPSLPRMLGEAEVHVFVMPLDACLVYLRSASPPGRATHVRVHTSTGDYRKRVSTTLQSAGVG